MKANLEIFSQGEEIVNGQVADTNAAWLSDRAVAMGFSVTRHTAVGDRLADLIGLLKEISLRADCCICTGGLGPTNDDLTAEAVAAAFGMPLLFDKTAYAQIERFFALRGREMPETNRKQAMLPKGALRIDNPAGTAPGFFLQAGRCRFAFLPGVPSEMKQMFSATLQDLLLEQFDLQPDRLVTIRTFGIGESDIQQCVAGITIPTSVQLGFRAGPDDVQTKLLFPSDYPEPDLNELVGAIADALGDKVFSIGGLDGEGGDLAATVDRLMRCGKHTLAVAETLSQGLLSAKCVGADWLLEARFAPSAARLAAQWGITLEHADLQVTAEMIADALQRSSAADFVLVQLYEGSPQVFRNEDDVIILYNMLLAGGRCFRSSITVAGPMTRKQNQAALSSLDLLRCYLQQKEL